METFVDMEFRAFARTRAMSGDSGFAIAFALMEIAEQHRQLRFAVDGLGLGGVASPMGATGHLTEHVTASLDRLSETLGQALTPPD